MTAKRRRPVTFGICCWICSGACSGFLVRRPWDIQQQQRSPFQLMAASLSTTQTRTRHNATIAKDHLYFPVLAEYIVDCLVKSELKRDSGFDGASVRLSNDDCSFCSRHLSFPSNTRACRQDGPLGWKTRRHCDCKRAWINCP